MARSRRPELEKDNPIAPQMYVVRRRRRRLSPRAQEGSPDHQEALSEALQALADAAEQFVNAVPRWRKQDAARQVLLDAITRAQLILSVERMPVRTAAH